MASETSEGAFEAALQDCGNIDAFVDNFFSFLARRTDFFMECPPEGGRLGFPPGHAESLVRSKFQTWQRTVAERTNPPTSTPKCIKSTPNSSDELNNLLKKGGEVSTSIPNEATTTPAPCSSSPRKCSKQVPLPDKSDDEAYNGRVTDKYSWSQTINEVDVTIPVGVHVKRVWVEFGIPLSQVHCKIIESLQGKQMQVTIETGRIFVAETGSNDSPIVEGRLTFPVKKEDCYWNLIPGECVRIWLHKSQERWWQALLEGEELLEMSKIEAVRPMEELDEEEQMKLQELCWNEERKRQGLPTSEEMKMQKILEQAWNVEGSPFKGTPMDPSIVKFSTQNQGTFVNSSDS